MTWLPKKKSLVLEVLKGLMTIIGFEKLIFFK
jgi:hypothetical protein